MPWNTPKTNFANGDVLTAVQMNAIGEDLQYLYDETPDTVLTTKGDLIVGDSTGNAARLAVGSDTQILTADSTAANGVKWASATAAGENFSLLSSSALTSGTSVTISGISAKNAIWVRIAYASTSTAGANISIRFNSDSGSNYIRCGGAITSGSTYLAANTGYGADSTSTEITVGKMNDAASGADKVTGSLLVWGCNSSGLKIGTVLGGANNVGGNNADTIFQHFAYTGTSTISSVTVVAGAGNFDAGTLYVYTSA